MSQKKYWQSFGEVNDPENFQKKAQDEFREELPFEDIDGKGLIGCQSSPQGFFKISWFQHSGCCTGCQL